MNIGDEITDFHEVFFFLLWYIQRILVFLFLVGHLFLSNIKSLN
jgi:hypothetical protein